MMPKEHKYKIGTKLSLGNKIIEVVGNTFTAYEVKIIKCPYDIETNMIRYMEQSLLEEVYTVLEEETLKSKCQCGAYKVGYVNASRSHSNWCEMYKE